MDNRFEQATTGRTLKKLTEEEKVRGGEGKKVRGGDRGNGGKGEHVLS